MKLQEFLDRINSKVGPRSAFDFARNARLNAIEKILIEKKIVTEEEISTELEKELDIVAEAIDEAFPKK
ncbi:MAG: hypothetical protein IPJ68_04450 [Candidatus Moraniibacteriota bacterium]|nr:MAG: hypothetical protein IPJ68_04450 [Candidatus Moranbacteria bacterium]